MPARPHDGPVPGPATFAGIFGSWIMAALATLFNFLALNLALLIASLPVVTLPAAVNAATVALDRWRGEGEDRVVREFIIALRSRPFLPTTIIAGIPLAAVAIGVAEARTSRTAPACPTASASGSSGAHW